MDIKQLFQTDEPRWFEDELMVSLFITLMAIGPGLLLGLLMATGWIAIPREALGILFLCTALPALLVGMPILFSKIVAHKTRTRSSVLARLDTVEKSDLVRMSASPELNETSRALVIEHLNYKHPGWSFDLSTVNSTT